MIVCYHPTADVYIYLPERYYERAKDLVAMGYTTVNYFNWLRKYHRENYSYIPFKTWVSWLVYCIENNYCERYIDKLFYRLQVAVLFYTDEVSTKTPETFLETRAWTIVPQSWWENCSIRHIIDRLEVEAMWLPFIIGSLYNAMRERSVSRISSKGYYEGRKILYMPYNVVATAVGYEVRHIDGDTDELTVDEANGSFSPQIKRGIAVYKSNMDSWRNAYAKYDNKWVSGVEALLVSTDTIYKFRYKGKVGLYAFKLYCRDVFKEVMDAINSNNRELAFYYWIKVAEILDNAWKELKTKFGFDRIGDLVRKEAMWRYVFGGAELIGLDEKPIYRCVRI